MTVEAALALCSLTVVLALAIGAIAAVAVQLRCLDAAREAARLVARGEPERARQAAAQIAPTGAHLDLAIRGDLVTATVTSPLLGRLSTLDTTAHAVGVLEPGVLPAVPLPPDPTGPPDPAVAPGPAGGANPTTDTGPIGEPGPTPGAGGGAGPPPGDPSDPAVDGEPDHPAGRAPPAVDRPPEQP